MARAEDRSRLVESYYPDSQTNEYYKIYKDYKLTYLMSNIVPQNIVTDGKDPWGKLEIFLSDTLVKQKGKELYIIAGRDGERKTFTAPVEGVDTNISAPSHVWKVFLVLEPGQGIADVTKDTLAFAVDIPNYSQNEINRGIPGAPTTPLLDDWKKYVVSVNGLEEVTGFNFLNNIPTDIQEIIESNTDLSKLLNLPTASLKANSTRQPYSVVEKLEPGTFINTSIRQSQVPDESVVDSEDRLCVNSSSQASTNQNGFFQVGVEQIGIPQSSFSQISSPQTGFAQVNIAPINSTQTSTSQISSAQIDVNQSTPNHTSSEQVGFTQVTPLNTNATQISASQINSSQVNIFEELGRTQVNPDKISLPSSITLQQFLSIHNSPPALINDINTTSLNLWNNYLNTQLPLNINFQITDLPTGQLAEATITSFDASGKPNAGTILIDADANGVGWYIDPTSLDNSEYTHTLADCAFQATPDSEAYGKYDLLTTLLHETAHLIGFIEGYSGFDTHVDHFSATLDGEHLDKEAHPHDLLNTHLAPGVRKLPSLLDVEILQTILAAETHSASHASLQAPLTSTPLLAVLNGSFDEADRNSPFFGWSTRGDSTIFDGQALLSEDSPFLSNFSQTFVIPESAKLLQFTLVDGV